MLTAPPSSELERTIAQLGQQLLDTWRHPDANLTFDGALREVLKPLAEFFPHVLFSATIYINSKTNLYRGRTIGPLERVILTNTSSPSGAAAYLVRHKHDLFVGDVNHWPPDVPPLPGHLTQAQPIAAFVGLPLIVGGADLAEVVGVLLVALAERQSFSAERQQLLRLFARQVAIVVQNARVLRRRRREEEAFRLVAISASAGDPDAVASLVARQVRELTKTAYVVVLMVNRPQLRLESRGASVFGDDMRPGSILLDLNKKSMNSHVYWTHQPHYAPDVERDLYYLLYPGWDEEMRSAYCVPLLVQYEVIGTIYVTSPQLNGVAEDDRRFLDQMASHAAIALHHASQIAEERRQRAQSEGRIDLLSRTKKFLEGITVTLPVDEQMHQIRTMFTTEGINTDGFFIATYDEDSGQIVLPKVIDRGREIDSAEKQPGNRFGPRRYGERHGLVDYVLRTQQTLLVDDFERWADREAIEPVFRSQLKCCLVAPLWRAGRIIGVIGLRGYQRTHMFSQRNRELLEGVTDEMAIVIENAYKYEAVLAALNATNHELSQRLVEWRAVSEFQRRISTINLNEGEEIQGTDIVDLPAPGAEVSIEGREIQSVYDEAMIALQGVGLNTRNMYIALYYERSQIVTFPLIYEHGRRVTDVANPVYAPRRLGDSPHVSEWVIEHSTALHFVNRRQMAEWAVAQPVRYRLPKRSHSWLAAPMIFKDRLLGAMVVRDFEHENSFSTAHRDLLVIAANQAAIAIENARLYERARRLSIQLRALFEAGRSVARAGFDLREVLHTILEQAIRVTGAHFGSIHRVEGHTLKLLDVWPEEDRERVAQQVGEMAIGGPGISALAVRNNRYQLVDDVKNHPAYFDVTGETGSELAVVLQRGDTNGERAPIGVLNVEHKQVGGLNRDHAGLLIAFSNLAAVAMQNAEQVNELDEVRERAYMSYAVAHMGLLGANWQHTIHQHTFGLSTYIDGLRDVLRLEQAPPALAGRVEDVLRRMRRTVDAILDTKWEGFLDTAPDEIATATKLDEALRAYVAELCSPYREVEVVYNLGCSDLYARIAPHSLRMAIEKLVSNGIQAMNGRGRLTVTSRKSGLYAHIYLADTGRGIPEFAREDFLKRPIRRPATATGRGTGAGALIARFIALNHGGNLELVSTQPEVGTTLLLKLRTLENVVAGT